MNINRREAVVVTAPEHRYFPPKSLKVFLAGGIRNCPDWQSMVINDLTDEWVDINSTYEHLFIMSPKWTKELNPPIDDRRQIEWEFDMLEKCDLFTMYFAGGDSDQPICMYELGRNIERMKKKYPSDWTERIVITCEGSYKRLMDVIIQVDLATDGKVDVLQYNNTVEATLHHCEEIRKKLTNIYCCDYEFNH